jgi:hypothetical protein
MLHASGNQTPEVRFTFDMYMRDFRDIFPGNLIEYLITGVFANEFACRGFACSMLCLHTQNLRFSIWHI